ncbi:MAG: hypothetical protein ACTTHG_00450 [Treponemataceae bacterium]
MKILILSESEKIHKTLNEYLESFGFALVNYKRLLKAMDNIEEINPDFVIINIEDYPRQWKTFLQYLTVFEGIFPIITCNAKFIKTEEQKEAEFLGVKAFISNIDNEENKKLLLEKINSQEKQEIKKIIKEKYKFMATNPFTNKILSGKVKTYENNILEFYPKYMENFKEISVGTQLTECTLKIEEKFYCVDVKVKSIDFESNIVKFSVLLDKKIKI